MEYFENFSFDGFWKKKQDDVWPEPKPTDDVIHACEKRIGYQLPKSYIALMRMTQNGGLLAKDMFQIKDTDGAVSRILTCTYLEAIGSWILKKIITALNSPAKVHCYKPPYQQTKKYQ